ncbi:MAG: IS21 family transposase [Planctomycetota bacterium]
MTDPTCPTSSTPPADPPPDADRTRLLFPALELTSSWLEDDPPPEDPPPAAGACLPPEGDPRPRPSALTSEERARAQELRQRGLSTRAIARQLGRSRKTIQRLFAPPTPKPEPAAGAAKKLDPFLAAVEERVQKGLTTTRILRELREQGYTGGRTILNRLVRSLRAPLAPRRKVTRRFETPLGEEIQVDWSTYRVRVGGKETVVHVLAMVLAHSRRCFLWATDSQRLERLLEGLELGLVDFEGCSQKVVFDNMTQVTLGRVGRDQKPIWNERFLPFVAHYGFEPVLCRIAHPDRKGEVEAVLGYFERDCLRGLEPESLAHLNELIRAWVREVANKRVHGTTRLVPEEVWEQERPYLIPLPDRRYPGACVVEVRRVAEDCTLSLLGTLYTVPARLAHQLVRVRLYSERFEVLDRDGAVALGREYVVPRDKGRLVIDPAHFADLPSKRSRARNGAAQRLEAQLLERWPALEDFLCGLKLRVKTLVHVHLRQLLRLAERFGDAALEQAAQRAHAAGLHTAQAVERILAAEHPELEDQEPVVPLGTEARVNVLLGEVEGGTLDDYAYLDDADGSEGAAASGGESNDA